MRIYRLDEEPFQGQNRRPADSVRLPDYRRRGFGSLPRVDRVDHVDRVGSDRSCGPQALDLLGVVAECLQDLVRVLAEERRACADSPGGAE